MTFVDSAPQDGAYEPRLGYILLEQSRASVDLVGHRLVPVKAFDLKAIRGGGSLKLAQLTPHVRKLPDVTRTLNRPGILRIGGRGTREL